VISGSEFASKGLAEHHTSPRDDGSDLRRNFPLFAHAVPCERDGSFPERSLPLRHGMIDGHCPTVLAIRGQERGGNPET
jgi:hypothetical protein